MLRENTTQRVDIDTRRRHHYENDAGKPKDSRKSNFPPKIAGITGNCLVVTGLLNKVSRHFFVNLPRRF
eukprot:906955-Amorphochlora_amoeboformis.AAC.1